MAQIKTNSITGSFQLFLSPNYFPGWKELTQPSVTVHYWQSWNGHRYLQGVEFPPCELAMFYPSPQFIWEVREALNQLQHEDIIEGELDPNELAENAERVSNHFESEFYKIQ